MDKFLGRTVGRKDDLLLFELEVIEDIMEYLLGLVFISEELHIIDEQDIHIIEFLEDIGELIGPESRDDLIDQLACRKIDHYLLRMFRHDIISYRLHQMGLSESHRPIEEKRIIGLSRTGSDCLCSGKRDIIHGSDDKGIE